ncbi:MAG: FKBP-type peptidyl-prolyl cis-trans isomerase [Actinomycetota bacterium]
MLRTAKLILVLLLLVAGSAACGSEDAADDSDPGAQPSAEEPVDDGGDGEAACYEEPFTTDSGLEITDTKCGDGEVAESGNTVEVHYVGTLEDGTQFDSSRERGEPFEFPLGSGMVIQGWDEGVVGMAVGGVRTLTIPPELGYGAEGAGDLIPPDSTLIFEIELLKVSEGPSR